MEHQHRDALAQLPLLQREVAVRQREAAELQDARKRLCDLSHEQEYQKSLAADFAHWEIVRKAALQEMQTLRLALEQSTNALDASNQKCRELELQLAKVQEHVHTSSHLHNHLQQKLQHSTN